MPVSLVIVLTDGKVGASTAAFLKPDTHHRSLAILIYFTFRNQESNFTTDLGHWTAAIWDKATSQMYHYDTCTLDQDERLECLSSGWTAFLRKKYGKIGWVLI